MQISREQAQDMADAHGSHDEIPRDGCPICDDRPLSSYPHGFELEARKLGIEVGSRVEGHDHDYDVDLAGVVTRLGQTRSGELEVYFTSELESFAGSRVALPARWITKVEAP